MHILIHNFYHQVIIFYAFMLFYELKFAHKGLLFSDGESTLVTMKLCSLFSDANSL